MKQQRTREQTIEEKVMASHQRLLAEKIPSSPIENYRVPNASGVPTIATWAEQFRNSPACSNYADGTKIQMERDLRQFAIYAGYRDLTPQLVADFWEWRQTHGAPSNQSMALTAAYLRMFLQWCERMGYADKQLSLLVPKVTLKLKPPIIVTPEQYSKIKDAAKGTIVYYATVCAYRTGMRLSDVCLLKWENINFDELVIIYSPYKTRKKGKMAACPIVAGGDLHQVLLELREIPPHPNPMWKPYVSPELAMSYPMYFDNKSVDLVPPVSNQFTHLCRRLGYNDLTFHKLRNAFMSRLVANNVSWPAACQITGLTSFEVYLRYAKPELANLRAQMAKLDEPPLCQS